MTEKKITKKEMFEMLLEMPEVQATEGMVDFINHEIELLNRKRTSTSKANKENAEIAEIVLDFFRANPNRLMTCTELMKMVNASDKIKLEKEMSLPKMSAVMTLICGTVKEPLPDAPITREKSKRQTVFKYVGE